MRELYETPWAVRYSSENMLKNFSDNKKYSTWRKLWITLAEAEHQVGMPVSAAQIAQLKEHEIPINYARVKTYQEQSHSGVLAHIKAYADAAPDAGAIIHLGASSAFVTDNCDIIQMRDGLEILRMGLVRVLNNLSIFAWEYRNLPCLAYTQFQAAKITSLGKRACLWIQSFLSDLKELEHILENLEFLGIKGSVGTGGAFRSLLEGDYLKYKRLDNLIAEKMGFKKTAAACGQAYDRKVDSLIVAFLGQIAQSAHKFTNDLRLLQHLKEIEEPIEEKLSASNPSPYKRSPILSERIASLAKFVISLSHSSSVTASTQWLERSLDDSANKRLTIPQAFLGADAVLLLCEKITRELTVHPKMIEKHISAELPFIAAEALLAEAVQKGGSPQELHDIIQGHSVQAGFAIKDLGENNKLLAMLAQDKSFPLSEAEIKDICRAENFMGFAAEQAEDFLQNEAAPILKRYDALISTH